MKSRILAMTMLAVLFFSACKKEEPISQCSLRIELQKPETLKDKEANIDASIEIKNLNSGEIITKEVTKWTLEDIVLETGLYSIILSSGTVNYTHEGETISINIKGYSENISIKNSSHTAIVPLIFYEQDGAGFVLSELYFVGSLNEKGRSYRQDKFFEIYNNSEKILYADGLCIASGKFQTTGLRKDLKPDIRSEAFALGAVYRVPGSGLDHLIKPGETLVLCDVGKNHKEERENYLDLSQADFEWYDEHKLDVDVPEMPNMEKIVSCSKSIFTIHNKGYDSYVLFKLSEAEAQIFAETNAYTFTWQKNESKVDTAHIWKIENERIIDAVECSTPSSFEVKTMDPSLDFSWTHIGDADPNRFGHSAKRKIEKQDGERIVLKDSNDSKEDFIATAPNPSPGTVEDHK